MALFQSSVITKHLQNQHKENIALKWENFKNHFHNPKVQEDIKSLKEEQYQGEFLEDFFVKILGYTKPASSSETKFNLTTEYKNIKDSKKADGAIIVNDAVKAVIELKGTNTTDLGKIEVQAFGYKNNQLDCTYVITSNFEKLRFYIDNAIEHIEFNLFTLTEKDFNLLYLCLAYENIEKDIPKKIKDQSISQEDAITKKLYNDYSLFKRELHQNLVVLNPQFDALELFQKSQKLLDRFLFLFFAEDRQLLPPNSVRLILEKWESLNEFSDDYPLYGLFKNYFRALNTGRKGEKYDIFAYNGGLFKPDEILDAIKIDNILLFKHILNLSQYDFDSEVDVNILGHIFENSLNELDEIKAQLAGETVDKTKTKRKKDGVFYTPKYITKYIVENTVGKLCVDKKSELEIIEEEYISTRGLNPLPLPKKKKQLLLEKLHNYRNWLLQLTICDPACGSGAFLNQALDFLINEHKYIDEMQAKLFGDAMVLSDVEKSILENNLFGVDLNEESVEIAKLSLWLRTAQPNRKLNDLNNNLKCGNSLIDDVEIAGDKAFNWQQEFPQIFKEKNKKAFHITTAVHDSRTSERMIAFKVREKRDLGTNPYPNICYFTEEEEFVITQTIANIVKDDNLNVLAYNICADHIHLLLVCEEENVPIIMQRIKGKTARVYNSHKGINPLVQKENEKSVPLWTQKFGCKEITTEAHLFTAIDYIKHNRSKHHLPQHSNKGFKPLVESINCSYEHAFRQEYKGGFDVVIGNPPYLNMTKGNTGVSFLNYYVENFESVKTANSKNLYTLFNEISISLIKDNGIVSFIIPEGFLKTRSYEDCVTKMNEFGVIRKAVYFEDWVFEDATTGSVIFEYLKNNEIKLEMEEYLMTRNRSLIKNEKKRNVIIEKYLNSKFPSILEICDTFKGMAVQNRTEFIFRERDQLPNKFLLGNCIDRNILKDSFYCDYEKLTIVGGTKKIEKHNISPRILIRRTGNFLCCVLLEKPALTESTLYSCSVKNDTVDIHYLLSILNSKFLTYVVRQNMITNEQAFPQILMTDIQLLKIPIIEKKEQLLFKEKSIFVLNSNKELQEFSNKYKRTLERKFELDQLPKKLQDWYLLTFPEFIKELGKKKVKLSLTQEAEWEDYFLQESKKALALKTDIDATDKEIDQMVYGLYGLTDEEIGIVEAS